MKICSSFGINTLKVLINKNICISIIISGEARDIQGSPQKMTHLSILVLTVKSVILGAILVAFTKSKKELIGEYL